MNFGEGKLVEAVPKIQGQNDTFSLLDSINIWHFKIHIEFLQWSICDSKSPEPEINSDWPIVLFLQQSESFYFTTDQKLLLTVAQPYYFKSPNLYYYYCVRYFIVIIIVVAIMDKLCMFGLKSQSFILLMVISMSMKPYRDLIYISRTFLLWYQGVRFLFSQPRKVAVNSITWESQL